MRGTLGVLVGAVLVAIALSGLGFALHAMMTSADPSGVQQLAGLGTFVVAILASLIVAR